MKTNLIKIKEIKPYEKNAKKQFNCVNCGKIWQDYQSNDKNKRFCSILCKSIYSRTDRTCKNCDKTFSICKSVLKTNATGNYCSRECYVKKITTGLTKNKNGFRTISDKIRKENPMCAICGTRRRIHIHHIKPYRYTKDNSSENLIPLCISHHKIVEFQTEKLLEIDGQENVFFIINNILRDRQQYTNFVCV